MAVKRFFYKYFYRHYERRQNFQTTRVLLEDFPLIDCLEEVAGSYEKGSYNNQNNLTNEENSFSINLKIFSQISSFLKKANVSSLELLLVICVSSLVMFLPLFFLNPYFYPLSLFVAIVSPYLYLQKKIKNIAIRFSEDFPTILQALASNLKLGLIPFHALEEAVRLLPEDSLCFIEVKKLLKNINLQKAPKVSLDQFAKDIELPELELFRKSFLLLLEHGGRFVPTLERLAKVSRERAELIREAHIGTSQMRYAGNALIFIAPFCLFITSSKIKNFWEIFQTDNTAASLAAIGITLIIANIIILKIFANFKP